MRPLAITLAAALLAIPAAASDVPDSAALTRLLNDFLAGASRDDAATHERFWAEPLVYTGSGGRRIGKADIMKDVRAPATTPASPPTTYTAEDVRIQQYGDTAIVAFRLVATTQRDGPAQVRSFLNTGTFRKQDGAWRAVAWQATRMPRVKEDAVREAAAAEAAFLRALRAGDVKALESLADESFAWTDGGTIRTRQQLADDLAAGRLKYAKLETSDVGVTIHGTAAVVRGRLLRQPGGDATPMAAAYTLTLVDDGAGWKPVALHSAP